jgi:hypothetical protein
MTKIELVEFIQTTLGGGVISDDVRKKYPTEVVEAALSMAMQDIMSKPASGYNLRDIVVMKTSEVSIQVEGTRSYIELPYRPMDGINSIGRVMFGGTGTSLSIHPNKVSFGMMSELKGTSMRNGLYPENERYYFVQQPFGSSIEVTMIPSLMDYDDQDELVLGDNHLTILQAVYQVLGIANQRIVDNINQQQLDNERN